MSDNDNIDGEAKSFYPRTNSCEDNDINNNDYDDDNVTEDECTVALIIIEENDDFR